MHYKDWRRISIIIGSLLFILAIACIIWRLANRQNLSTDDAYVTADYTLLAPKVSGYVERVLAEDNQFVTAGTLLVKIDDRDFRNALNSAVSQQQSSAAKLAGIIAQQAKQQALIQQAEATVAANKASLRYSQKTAQRYNHLLQSGSGSVDMRDQSSSAMQQQEAQLMQNQAGVSAAIKQVDVLNADRAQAEAMLHSANTDVERAQLNLSYTQISAPIAGTIGQRTVRPGAYIAAGTRLLAIVPLQQVYIVANFRETQLKNVHPGQKVRIRADALSTAELWGRVDSVAPATGGTFSPIAPDNATGNYTKVVQRLPVKIILEPGQQPVAELRVGMSVVVELLLYP